MRAAEAFYDDSVLCWRPEVHLPFVYEHASRVQRVQSGSTVGNVGRNFAFVNRRLQTFELGDR
jgi:hypothetical protein